MHHRKKEVPAATTPQSASAVPKNTDVEAPLFSFVFSFSFTHWLLASVLISLAFHSHSLVLGILIVVLLLF
jgi:hypothetical protein